MLRPSPTHFTKTITLQRPSVLKTPTGASKQSWTDVPGSTDMEASIHPMSGGEMKRFAQRMLSTSHLIYLVKDPGFRRGDRFIDDEGIKYRILAVMNLGGRDTLWECEVKEMP